MHLSNLGMGKLLVQVPKMLVQAQVQPDNC